MKKLLCSLVVGSLLALPAVAVGAPSLKERLEALTKESLQSKPACEAFKKLVGEIVPPGEIEPLTRKAQAMKLLALARSYPGTPGAYNKALAEAAGENSSGEIGKEEAELLSSLYGCEWLSLFSAYQVLILSAGPLRFTAKERNEVAEGLYESLRRDLDSHDNPGLHNTLIHVAIYGELLASLVDEKVVPASDAIFTETVRWNEQLLEARLKLRDARQSRETTTSLELRLMRPLSASLVRVARWLSKR